MPCLPYKCRNLTVYAPKSYQGKFKLLCQAIVLGSCFHQSCFSHHSSLIVLYTVTQFEERFLPPALSASTIHRVADAEVMLAVFLSICKKYRRKGYKAQLINRDHGNSFIV